MSKQKTLVRRERRFEVGDLTGFDAIVSRVGSEDAEYFAELIDFSRAGVKFSLPFFARFDELLKIRFVFKHSNLKYVGTGRVRHIRNVGDKRWLVGCSIDPELTEEVVSFLAKRTNQERRRYHRIDVDGTGELVRQGTIEGCLAHVINISEGGFCLLAEKQQEPGQQVDFRIRNKHGALENIAARVRWQNELDGRFRIGCGYANTEAYEKLIDCLTFQESHGEGDEKISWFVAAVACLAMFLPPICFFLLDSNSPGETQPVLAVSRSAVDEPVSDLAIAPAESRESPFWPTEMPKELPIPAELVTVGSDSEISKEISFLDVPSKALATQQQPDSQPTAEVPVPMEFERLDREQDVKIMANDGRPLPAVETEPDNADEWATTPLFTDPTDQPSTFWMSAVPDLSATETLPVLSDRRPIRRNETAATAPLDLGSVDTSPGTPSSRRDSPPRSRTTLAKPPRSISFQSRQRSNKKAALRTPEHTDTPSFEPDGSSRRRRHDRPPMVPSEVIRKIRMSDPPD